MSTKPTTEMDIERFATKLINQQDNHDAWLTIIRYGFGTLLDNQPLLMDLIVREAVKEVERHRFAESTVPNQAARIMGELGLRFTL